MNNFKKSKLLILLLAGVMSILFIACGDDGDGGTGSDDPKPTANFDVSTSGAIVSITNKSMHYDSLHWDFGDGTTGASMEATFDHTYQSAGTFIITLEVFNLIGDTATSTRSVTSTVQNLTPSLGALSAIGMGSVTAAYTMGDVTASGKLQADLTKDFTSAALVENFVFADGTKSLNGLLADMKYYVRIKDDVGGVSTIDSFTTLSASAIVPIVTLIPNTSYAERIKIAGSLPSSVTEQQLVVTYITEASLSSDFATSLPLVEVNNNTEYLVTPMERVYYRVRAVVNGDTSMVSASFDTTYTQAIYSSDTDFYGPVVTNATKTLITMSGATDTLTFILANPPVAGDIIALSAGSANEITRKIGANSYTLYDATNSLHIIEVTATDITARLVEGTNDSPYVKWAGSPSQSGFFGLLFTSK